MSCISLKSAVLASAALVLACSLLAPAHATDPDTFSPVVSYQFQESLADGTSSIVSPVVSYQYFDWIGDENVTFQYSADVSYYFPDISTLALKIASIGSGTIIAQAGSQTVAVTGKNFVAGSHVQLRRFGDSVFTPVNVTVVGSTGLHFDYVFAAAGTWTAKMVNSDGTESQPFTFEVVTGPAGFQLSFPLKANGWTPYTANISSVFDHRTEYAYQPGGGVGTFDGQDAVYQAPGAPVIFKGRLLYSFYREQLPPRTNILSGFANYVGVQSDGPERATIANYDGHDGCDYAVPEGTEVYAAAAGIAVLNYIDDPAKGGGIWVRLENEAAGYRTGYFHLQSIDAALRPGAPVEKGQPIGLSGKTGTDSPHLHFEVSRLVGPKQWVPVDPYGWTGPPNADPYKRAQNVTLWQGGPPSELTILPETVSVASTGTITPQQVAVMTVNTSYTAAVLNNATWLTIDSGASGTGSGTLGFSVAANAGATRLGEIDIRATTGILRRVTITQSGPPGLNPTPAEVAAKILEMAKRHRIPAPIIAAVAYKESAFTWHQFNLDGTPIVGPSGDIGLMQINVGTPAVPDAANVVRLREDWIFNLDVGCQILKQKFNATAKNTASPYDGPEDTKPEILENWFYAVAR